MGFPAQQPEDEGSGERIARPDGIDDSRRDAGLVDYAIGRDQEALPWRRAS